MAVQDEPESKRRRHDEATHEDRCKDTLPHSCTADVRADESGAISPEDRASSRQQAENAPGDSPTAMQRAATLCSFDHSTPDVGRSVDVCEGNATNISNGSQERKNGAPALDEGRGRTMFQTDQVVMKEEENANRERGGGEGETETAREGEGGEGDDETRGAVGAANGEAVEEGEKGKVGGDVTEADEKREDGKEDTGYGAGEGRDVSCANRLEMQRQERIRRNLQVR